jgi:magnesium transporter
MEKVLQLIDKKKFIEARQELEKRNVVDIATLFEEMSKENVVKLFRVLPKDIAADVFAYMEHEQRVLIIDSLTDKEVSNIINDLFIDDTVDFLEELPANVDKRVLKNTDEEYLKTSAWTLAKHRIIWLLVLMISATFTGNIIKRFEDVLESVVILAAFIPMLMDTGGNAGSQSSTLVIRGLALGDINIKDIFKVVFKEFRVSFIVAIVLSVVNFIRIYYFEKTEFFITLTVCVTLFFTILLAKILGAILPITAKRFNMDPAIMASPLITTIVDAVALIVYFSMAAMFLGI